MNDKKSVEQLSLSEQINPPNTNRFCIKISIKNPIATRSLRLPIEMMPSHHSILKFISLRGSDYQTEQSIDLNIT